MDAVSDASIEQVVFIKSAQVGATEIIGNVVGYYIDQDPAPILVIQPTLEMGQAWSKDRLAPMVRDTPALRGKIRDPRTRDSGNTQLHKTFPGGRLTIAGANSPAGLASRPIRVLLCDEVDRFPVSAGTEGDPVSLAKKRTAAFWNRKIVLASTPTIKGKSRIEMAWEGSDQRRYFVPCPHCKVKQTLKWVQIRWGKNGKRHLPETTVYECERCGKSITDADKPEMLAAGEWRAGNRDSKVAGFHINEMYSPWTQFSEIVEAFLEAKKTPETLKTWVNTTLGESWQEAGDSVDEDPLYARREVYGPEVPSGACLLTCGVDVQDDRLECEVVAWGPGEESWGIQYDVFHGDPGKEELWKRLDDHLNKTWLHESGVTLRITAAGIDTGGHYTEQTYRFVKPRQGRGVFALKGRGGAGLPLVSGFSKNNKGKVKLFSIGVDGAKETLYFSRLNAAEPGPGYCHFPTSYNQEYFHQLTGEQKVQVESKGRMAHRWEPKTSHRRVEALDCRVYATAALGIANPDLELLAKQIDAAVDRGKAEAFVQNKPRRRRMLNGGI